MYAVQTYKRTYKPRNSRGFLFCVHNPQFFKIQWINSLMLASTAFRRINHPKQGDTLRTVNRKKYLNNGGVLHFDGKRQRRGMHRKSELPRASGKSSAYSVEDVRYQNRARNRLKETQAIRNWNVNGQK